MAIRPISGIKVSTKPSNPRHTKRKREENHELREMVQDKEEAAAAPVFGPRLVKYSGLQAALALAAVPTDQSLLPNGRTAELAFDQPALPDTHERLYWV